jgi:hypothetical protein
VTVFFIAIAIVIVIVIAIGIVIVIVIVIVVGFCQNLIYCKNLLLPNISFC